MRIPERQGITLTKRGVCVPRDFTGARNAVFLMFEASHTVLLPAWHSALNGVLQDCGTAVGFYAIAIADEDWAWRRRLTRWALTQDIPGGFLREHTAVLHCDLRVWQREASLFTFEAPIVAVSTPAGEVSTIVSGGPTRSVMPQLERALRGSTVVE